MRFLRQYAGLALVAVLSLGLMGFTPKKVDTRNQKSLVKSLDEMLEPLSRKEQKQLMQDFFLVAYKSDMRKNPFNNSNDVLWSGYKRLDEWTLDSAVAYLADGRMDPLTPQAAYTRYKMTGHSDKKSFYLFLDAYGDEMDGVSGHEIVARAAALRNKTSSDNKASAIKDLEDEIREHKATLAKLEAEAGACENAVQIYHRRRIAYAQDRLAAVKSGGPRPPTQVISAGANAANKCSGKTKVVDSSGTLDDGPTSELDQRMKRAKGQIRIKDAKNLKIVMLAGRARMEADFTMKIGDLSGKAIKRVEYGIQLSPKSGQMPVILRGSAPSYLEKPPGIAEIFTHKSAGANGSATKKGEYSDDLDDYTITPYVYKIYYTDKSKDIIANNSTDVINWLKDTKQIK